MKRKQIVERIAQERAVPLHTAADWFDTFLHDLIQQLKGLSANAAPQAPPAPKTLPDAPPAPKTLPEGSKERQAKT